MGILSVAKSLPLLAAYATAAATYPPIPADLTTPVQQRLSINGANSMFLPTLVAFSNLTNIHHRRNHSLEYLHQTNLSLRPIRHFPKHPNKAILLVLLHNLPKQPHLVQRSNPHLPDPRNKILLQNHLNQLHRVSVLLTPPPRRQIPLPAQRSNRPRRLRQERLHHRPG